MSLKNVEQKKTRTIKERHAKMEAMIKVLISKFDEMIGRQGVPSHKEKEVKMPTIRVTMNDKSVGDNSKEKKSFQRLIIRKLL
jgi:hypothetical protein